MAIDALATSPASALATHTGICDASAVALLDADRFIVASDEENVLYIYHFETKSPLCPVKLDEFLESRQFNKPEADLEGVARIDDDTLIWIGSHGRNKNGKFRPARHVLFATGIKQSDATIREISMLGTPYRKLAQDLSEHSALAELELGHTTWVDDKTESPELAPKQSGLNIEGLVATPEGKLLIGLRNPLAPEARAILMPMNNPMDVLTKGEKPRFAEKPILLDLGGLGIRAIEYVPEPHAAYYILAGPKDDGEVFLYRWSGKADDVPVKLQGFGTGAGEGLALGPKEKRLFIVFDSGSKKIDDVKCKKLDQKDKKRFDTSWIPLDGG